MNLRFQAEYDALGIIKQAKKGCRLVVNLDVASEAVDVGKLARVSGKLVTVDLRPLARKDDWPTHVRFACEFEQYRIKKQKDDSPKNTIVLTMPKDDSLAAVLAVFSGSECDIDLEPPVEDLSVSVGRRGQTRFDTDEGVDADEDDERRPLPVTVTARHTVNLTGDEEEDMRQMDQALKAVIEEKRRNA